MPMLKYKRFLIYNISLTIKGISHLHTRISILKARYALFLGCVLCTFLHEFILKFEMPN